MAKAKKAKKDNSKQEKAEEEAKTKDMTEQQQHSDANVDSK